MYYNRDVFLIFRGLEGNPSLSSSNPSFLLPCFFMLFTHVRETVKVRLVVVLCPLQSQDNVPSITVTRANHSLQLAGSFFGVVRRKRGEGNK